MRGGRKRGAENACRVDDRVDRMRSGCIIYEERGGDCLE